jgi:hypothetical protein
MGCLRVLPGSAAVPLPAKSRSCLYSSRCLRRPPHQPITRVLLLHCHSQLLFKLCLVKLTASTRPDLVRVRVRFGPLFAPLPPSLAQLRRSQDTTRYDIDCVNRASTFSLSVCLSVCQSRTALFRSTYTVQGPLCPNREPC